MLLLHHQAASAADASAAAFNFFMSTWFISPGLTRPALSFITWPVKKPASFVLPPQYCSSCLGLAASTRATISSTADSSGLSGGGDYDKAQEEVCV